MPQHLFDINSLERAAAEGAIVLTANHRLARRINDEWSARCLAAGHSAWEPLAVKPLEHWLLSQWERAVREGLIPPRLLLSRQQELLIWQQIIEGDGEAALLRPAAAADWASEARELLLRHANTPPTSELFSHESDCAAFWRWRTLFDQRLMNCGQLTAADAMLELLRAAPSLSSVHAVLVACDDMAPLLHQCVDVLCETSRHLALNGLPAPCEVLSYADERAELEGVAAWAAALHSEHPDATIGIVLEGSSEQRTGFEYLLRRAFDCLGDNYNQLPVNFSTGIALADTPVVRDALLVLELGLHSVSLQSVEALLRSRFLDLPDAATPLAIRFFQRLCDNGVAELSVASLRNLASTIALDGDEGLMMGRHLQAMASMRELQQRVEPSQWVARFNAVLDCWGWPGSQSLDSLEFQQVTLWYEVLDTLHTLDAMTGEVDYASALALLRDACARTISHPSTADTPVQVLGPIEAVGLSFDHLWLCAMQASRWPAPPKPNPFIPMKLQAGYAMPRSSPARELAFAERLLDQYRLACGRLHASYSRQVDGVAELPSALLATLSPGAAQPADVERGARVSPAWSAMCQTASLEAIIDSNGPVLDAREATHVRGGASMIEHQSQCPFRAFVQHRLTVKALSEPAHGISPAERGQVVHEALQRLWESVGDQATLLQLTTEQYAKLAAQSASAGIAHLPQHRRQILGAGCLAIEQERLQPLLLEWLDIERQRSSFVVESMEEGVELALGPLTVKLRVDRIDRLDNGSKVIIDYKTGESRVKDWLGRRPGKPQLLLYGLAAGEHPAALTFARIKPGKCQYVGVGDIADAIPGVQSDIPAAVGQDMAATDWAELNNLWEENLYRLADEFVHAKASVDPLPRACDWCDLGSLCRIAREDNAGAYGLGGRDSMGGGK